MCIISLCISVDGSAVGLQTDGAWNFIGYGNRPNDETLLWSVLGHPVIVIRILRRV